jgi:tetratricopeptide (TPR) repeat protein
VSPDGPAADRSSELSDRFAAELRELWLAAGQMSCRQISRDLESQGTFHSKSSISDVLRGARLPKHEMVRDLVTYFGGDVSAWIGKLNAIRTTTGHPGDRHPAPAEHEVAPRQLPAPCTRFTGRHAQLDQLDLIFEPGGPNGTAPTPAVAAVIGPGGVGKTSLVLRWAHRHVNRFPDGQLYVDLRGFGPAPPVPAATVVTRFLVALGIPATDHPPDTDMQVALYRSLVADRRILVVLDNAANSEQVLPLLPGGSRCAVLATSRTTLGTLTVRGAGAVSLGVLDDEEARELLVGRLGRQRAGDARDGALSTLVKSCGGLPLALSIVAARAVIQPERPLDELAAELREDTTRLDALSVGELEGDLRRVLSWSYDALPVEAAGAFRLLGLAPGTDIGFSAAAALLGLGRAATGRMLRCLMTAHLLEESSGRYRMHDLVRLFAAELSAETDRYAVRSEAVRQLSEWYLRHADRADRFLAPNRTHVLPDELRADLDVAIPDYEHAMAWYHDEHANLAAAVHSAAAYVHNGLAWQLPLAAYGYYRISHNWREWFDLQQVALTAARADGSESAEAWALNAVGIAHTSLRQDVEAAAAFEESLAIRRRIGDRAGEGQVLNNLSELTRRLGRYADAIGYARADHTICRELGDTYGEAISLNNLGKALLGADRAGEALVAHRRALVLCNEIDERHVAAEIFYDLGETYRRLGTLSEAVRHYQAAVDVCRSVGDTVTMAWALLGLGELATERGDHPAAGHCADQVATMVGELSGTASIEALRTRLGALRRRTAADSARA